MEHFNTEKLEGYNNERKQYLKQRIDEIQSHITIARETIQKMVKSADEQETIRLAMKAIPLIKEIHIIDYPFFLSLQNELRITNESQYKELKIKHNETDDYSRAYNELKYFSNEMYKRYVDNITLYPKKGTSQYCNCKEYDTYDRVELGKIIKRDLMNQYPGIRFSVTTNDDCWKSVCNIILKEASEDYDVSELFIRQMKDYLMKYQPTIDIRITTFK